MDALGQPQLQTRLHEMGLFLGTQGVPPNRFLLSKRVGDLVFVSSVTPVTSDGLELAGEIGSDVSIAEARIAARWCAANSLACLIEGLEESVEIYGPIDVMVFCNAPAGFGQQSEIADGASEVFEELFGPNGSHTRGAIGASSLVRNASVVLKASYHVRSGSKSVSP